jgi:hypothetical protein
MEEFVQIESAPEDTDEPTPQECSYGEAKVTV